MDYGDDDKRWNIGTE